jgi:succinate dehydrogenase/fumarate reductase flavoprotein subunit
MSSRAALQADGAVDLLVLGAGMAGLSAAAAAAQRGARVIVVEKDATIGGSAKFAGFIWTAPTLEVMRGVNPDGDPELAKRLVDGYQPAIEWVRSLGIDVQPAVTVLRFGRGHGVDMTSLLRRCHTIVKEAGGELLVDADAERLLLSDGEVRGAEVRLSSGDRRVIEARSTLLATGGFGGDPELRERHIHPSARGMPVRANSASDGQGLRLGLSAGATFGSQGASFYGHLMPYGVRVDDPLEFTTMTMYHSEHGVLVNLEGRRFVDETVGDHLSTIALAEQPEARCLMITDERVHREWMLKPYVEGVEAPDKFRLAYRRGARCAVAEDLDELALLPPEWGYPGEVVRDTLTKFNRQCEAGYPEPSRREDPLPLEAPYYVMEVVAAITFTFGGVLIDPRARVLAAGGGVIPGLLAAGADAGGVYNRAYVGGLACALVFGMQAASTALESVASDDRSRSSPRTAPVAAGDTPVR